MYPISKPVRVTIGVVCAVIALTAVGGGIAAYLLPEKPAWTAVGFELVTLVTGVLGLVMAGNRFRSGPGLALACIAGTILVSSGLAYLAGGSRGQAGDGQVRMLLASRVVLAGVLAFFAASLVLGRRQRAWKLAIHGAALAGAGPTLALLHRQTDGNWFAGPEGGSLGVTGVALLGLCAACFAVTSVFAFVRSAMAEEHDYSGALTRFFLHMFPLGCVVLLAIATHGHVNDSGGAAALRVGLGLTLVVFLGGWFCGGAHMLIRAFEMGRIASHDEPDAAASVAA